VASVLATFSMCIGISFHSKIFANLAVAILKLGHFEFSHSVRLKFLFHTVLITEFDISDSMW
jgi:membrane-bound metal-dependent hydrolase YbcI (DUF457 family)